MLKNYFYVNGLAALRVLTLTKRAGAMRAAVQNVKDPFSVLRDLTRPRRRAAVQNVKNPFSVLRDLARLLPDFGLGGAGSVCEFDHSLANGLVNQPSTKFTQERDLVSEINCRTY
jgi:hypothetical protein